MFINKLVMYTSIVFLPFLAAILSGLFGRMLGVKGVYFLNIICILIATLLSFVAFYEVILCNSPISVELFNWINSEHLKISWSFYFDELTVAMLIPVMIVSVLVHIYSIGYMGEDPHVQRFFCYISLFTGLMLVLVSGNNFLVMFLGWEGVGVCSYLLVHFWYTRIAAVKSGMNAMFTNRVGDYFLTIGFFTIFYTFGSLDYAIVFSLAPYINVNVITLIALLLLVGAAAKSAQIGLHIWLPFAMEGDRYEDNYNSIYWIKKNSLYIYNVILFRLKNKKINIFLFNFSFCPHSALQSGDKYISGNSDSRCSMKLNKSNKRRNSLIWVYDINNSILVEKAPFKTKTECAENLGINRGTVRAYLESGKLYKNKWIFSYVILNKEELSKWKIPSKVMEIITGELLGDGYINYNIRTTGKHNGRLEFTFSAKNIEYAKYLKYKALDFICTDSELTPWPNPKKTNKKPTQYWFCTKSLPIFRELHTFWYKKINNKLKKVLPSNIEELITPVSLAHWIMGDGYSANGGVKICTDNFSEEEVLRLINILNKKFELKCTINRRITSKGNLVWRIYISKLCMEKLKELIIPYFIPEMLYKLSIK
jgi:hypothetical protein